MTPPSHLYRWFALCALSAGAFTQTVTAEITQCIRDQTMPEGYRLANYRRPTPDCVPGGVTLNTREVAERIQRDPSLLLVDVWALLLRSEPDFGHEWLPTETHFSLPGAHWLPNVGYGEPGPLIIRWFEQQLTQLTQGNKARPLLFFCVADCWMSWNAAIRAQSLGYQHVLWYPDGTSGWEQTGRQLTPVSPQPIED